MFKSGDRAAPPIRLTLGDISPQRAVELLGHWTAGADWEKSRGRRVE
jgi:hypothetical protein